MKSQQPTTTTPKARGTFLVQSRHGNGPSSTFVHCNSPDPYVPYHPPYQCPVSVNRSLNLHLGLPFNPRNIPIVRLICHFFSYIFQFIELYFFQAWESIPIAQRQSLAIKAWSLYLPLHRLILKNKTAIHKHASEEYHALSTIMYWGRLFPVSIRRIRFSLSQLAVWHGPDVYPKDDDNSLQVCFDRQTQGQNLITVETVHYDYYYNNNNTNNNSNSNNKKISMRDVLSQRESKRAVKGYYIHNPTSTVTSGTKNCKSNTTNNTDTIDDDDNNNNYNNHVEPPRKKVLFYLYGGAFLGGDTKGNVHYGTKLSQQCNMDVFLPQYGLLPEYHFLDALEDVIQAYVYLIEIRGIHPKDVILFGISSGGGLVVRLLQRIVQVRGSGGSGSGGSISSSVNEMLQVPSGAVLLSPFVDYTTPKGSFKEYTVHDLVVNESVFEEGIPYFSTLGNDKTRHDESPINRPLAGLPPLCMVVSEHECCYDQNIVLCNRARKEGVQVDLGVWKYMCHVWPVLTAFLPEARSAIDFFCEWIVQHKNGEDVVND